MARTGREARWAEVGVRLGSDSDVSLTDTWSSARRVSEDSGSFPVEEDLPKHGPPAQGTGCRVGRGPRKHTGLVHENF